MLYQLNYTHHLWDCKGSIFSTRFANYFYNAVKRTAAEWPLASMTVRVW